MQRLVCALAVTMLAVTLSGCASSNDAGNPAALNAPARPGDPLPAVVEPENYDEGEFLVNPFHYVGLASERSGYPYQGNRIGCDLSYFPSINYCKYTNHPERLTRIDRVFETDAQGLVDDWDLFWQQDRVTYLSRFPQR